MMSKKIRKGDIIDFTTRKRIDPTKSLIKCPVCGKIGEKHRGKTGDMYVHKYKLHDVFGVLSTEIVASCIVPKELPKPKPVCAICKKVIKEKHYAILEDEKQAHLGCLLEALPKGIKNSKEEPIERAVKLKEAVTNLLCSGEEAAVADDEKVY